MVSDGAANAMQAWEMMHGDPLLHGWYVTDVSFYTTELPQYMLVEAVAGLRPEVVHICAAITYTLLVLLAAAVARGRARGAEGAVRALLAAGVMLVPQSGDATGILLTEPDHVGAAVPVLLLMLLLDWARPRWYVPAAVFAVLALAIVGEPLPSWSASSRSRPSAWRAPAQRCRDGGCRGSRSRSPAPPSSRYRPRR